MSLNYLFLSDSKTKIGKLQLKLETILGANQECAATWQSDLPITHWYLYRWKSSGFFFILLTLNETLFESLANLKKLATELLRFHENAQQNKFANFFQTYFWAFAALANMFTFVRTLFRFVESNTFRFWWSLFHLTSTCHNQPIMWNWTVFM